VLRARVVTCVRVVALILCLVCVAHPNLTSVTLCGHLCKGERLQVVNIFALILCLVCVAHPNSEVQAKHRGIQVGLLTA
jgi:hypothetical protein